MRSLCRASIALVVAVAASGCGARQATCNSGADAKLEKGARTGVAGAKAGVETGVQGVKAFGSAVGGLVTGGPDASKQNWKRGKANTKATAKHGASDTSAAAHDCR